MLHCNFSLPYVLPCMYFGIRVRVRGRVRDGGLAGSGRHGGLGLGLNKVN